jgi:hypothetical protein
METALIGIGATAATNLLEEFVIRKFTPGTPTQDPIKPQNLITKLRRKPTHEGD